MNLIYELREKKAGIPRQVSKVICSAFKENTDTRVITLVFRIRPRTKHINNMYWHIVEHVEKEMISIK